MEDKCYTEPTKGLIILKGTAKSEVEGKSFHTINCGERFASKHPDNMESFVKIDDNKSMHVIRFGERIR